MLEFSAFSWLVCQQYLVFFPARNVETLSRTVVSPLAAILPGCQANDVQCPVFNVELLSWSVVSRSAAISPSWRANNIHWLRINKCWNPVSYSGLFFGSHLARLNQYSLLKVHLDQWSLTRKPSLLAVAPTVSSGVTHTIAQTVETPSRQAVSGQATTITSTSLQDSQLIHLYSERHMTCRHCRNVDVWNIWTCLWFAETLQMPTFYSVDWAGVFKHLMNIFFFIFTAKCANRKFAGFSEYVRGSLNEMNATSWRLITCFLKSFLRSCAQKCPNVDQYSWWFIT